MKFFLFQILLIVFSTNSFAQNTVIVSTTKANLREKPSTSSKIVGTVSKGIKLKVSDKREDWFYITYKNIKGWVHSKTIKIDYSNTENLPDLTEMEINDATDTYIKNYIKLRNLKINEWLNINEFGNETYYFNPSKIMRTNELVKFWLKVSTTDKKSYWRTKYKTLGIPFDESVSHENFTHSLDQYIADCKQKKMRLLREVTYFNDGTTGGVDLTDSEIPMIEIIPDSLGEAWMEIACAVK